MDLNRKVLSLISHYLFAFIHFQQGILKNKKMLRGIAPDTIVSRHAGRPKKGRVQIIGTGTSR